MTKDFQWSKGELALIHQRDTVVTETVLTTYLREYCWD